MEAMHFKCETFYGFLPIFPYDKSQNKENYLSAAHSVHRRSSFIRMSPSKSKAVRDPNQNSLLKQGQKVNIENGNRVLRSTRRRKNLRNTRPLKYSRANVGARVGTFGIFTH